MRIKFNLLQRSHYTLRSLPTRQSKCILSSTKAVLEAGIRLFSISVWTLLSLANLLFPHGLLTLVPKSKLPSIPIPTETKATTVPWILVVAHMCPSCLTGSGLLFYVSCRFWSCVSASASHAFAADDNRKLLWPLLQSPRRLTRKPPKSSLLVALTQR